MYSIQILQGDITRLEVDAIVNAANERLNGGDGVDGAIHLAAGPGLLQECLALGGCPTGEARITKGYSLKAKYVIHTVGPVWFEESDHESRLLENCYRNSLQLAVEHDIRTIAFPAISTGAYGFPPGPAARIAMGTTREFLESGNHSMEVTFVCFDEGSLRHYEAQI